MASIQWNSSSFSERLDFAVAKEKRCYGLSATVHSHALPPQTLD